MACSAQDRHKRVLPEIVLISRTRLLSWDVHVSGCPCVWMALSLDVVSKGKTGAYQKN